MDISFFKPKEVSGSHKITVHKTGKLGFSKSAAELLDLKSNRFCKIGRDRESNGNDILFMIICKEKDDLTYNISKAGDYFYIKAVHLLMELEIDYKDESVTTIYDIEKKKIDGNDIFKLRKRVLEKRKTK